MTQTGTIYLDPGFMWLNELEKDDTDTEPDHRSAYGLDLQFVIPWRYVKENEVVSVQPDEAPRSIEDMKYPVAALLYHELAHANDFFPFSRQDSLNPTVPIGATIGGATASSRLSSQFSLASDLMRELAAVSFHGNTADASQRQILPVIVEAEFSTDYASDYYNYSSQGEDLAMAFEEAMMLFSFGVDRDIAITSMPATKACGDFIVT